MADLIAVLDRMLARNGETVTLRRRVGTSSVFVELTLRARLTGYAAHELVGAIKQSDSRFVFSPTEINAAVAAGAWPGAAGLGALPRIGDLLRSAGGPDRKIEAIQPVRIGGQIVRFDGRVLG